MTKKVIFLGYLLCNAIQIFGQKEYHHIPIDTLLKPLWEVTLEDWSVYDGKPLVKNGVLFPYDIKAFDIDIKTGNKITIRKKINEKFQNSFNDNLLLRDNYARILVTNIYTDSVVFSLPRKGPTYYGYVSPELVSNDTIFVAKNSNTILAINLLDKSTIWEFSCEEKLCTKPKVIAHNVMFCDKNSLYIVDRNSGNIIKQKKFEGRIVSGIEVNEETLYLWVKGEGLYAMDQRTLKTKWNFNEFEYQFGNYRLIFEEDTVFFASWNLFALDKLSGKVIWRSDYGDISLVHNIALIDDFIVYYDSGNDGTVSFITAAEKNTGERKILWFHIR